MRAVLQVDEESLSRALYNLGSYLRGEILALSDRILKHYTESLPEYTGRLKKGAAKDVGDYVNIEGVDVPTEISITGPEHGVYLERGTGPYAGNKSYNPPFAKISAWATYKGLNPGPVYSTIRRRGTKQYFYARQAMVKALGGKWVISEL